MIRYKRKKKRKLSEEHKRKIGLAGIGRIPWNKGLKYKGGWTRTNSPEARKKMSISLKGKIPWNKGIRGAKSHNWKGGKSELTHKIRTSVEYIQWRSDIFKRDNWTCQTCGKRGGGRLEAHHIISLKKLLEKISIDVSVEDRFLLALSLPELFDLDNGITLCRPCHILTFEGGKDGTI